MCGDAVRSGVGKVGLEKWGVVLEWCVGVVCWRCVRKQK